MSCFQCPVCQTKMQSECDMDDLLEIGLGGTELRLLKILLTLRGRGIRKEALIGMIYSSTRDGGPLTASKCIDVSFFNLRKKIKKYGWVILSNEGGGNRLAVYHLAPLSVAR